MSVTLTPEQIAEMVKQTPTRLVHYHQCQDCLREWKAPAAKGNCPSCHSANTAVTLVVPCIEKQL